MTFFCHYITVSNILGEKLCSNIQQVDQKEVEQKEVEQKEDEQKEDEQREDEQKEDEQRGWTYIYIMYFSTRFRCLGWTHIHMSGVWNNGILFNKRWKSSVSLSLFSVSFKPDSTTDVISLSSSFFWVTNQSGFFLL